MGVAEADTTFRGVRHIHTYSVARAVATIPLTLVLACIGISMALAGPDRSTRVGAFPMFGLVALLSWSLYRFFSHAGFRLGEHHLSIGLRGTRLYGDVLGARCDGNSVYVTFAGREGELEVASELVNAEEVVSYILARARAT